MPDVLLFGASGYTGRLTAHALYRRGADFALAGRSKEKLDSLARETGGPEVRIAAVGDVDALVDALDGVKVMITCVGPFETLGHTAVEAALRAGVNYVDSTGEGSFIRKLIDEHDGDARARKIAMAPAMAFDEVPADVAATLATEGMDEPQLVLTYALPSSGSAGTVASALGIMTTPGPWIINGAEVFVGAGERRRWAPMPPPLGPRPSVSAPLAELYLAPLHLDLRTLKVFVTAGGAQRFGLRYVLPAVDAAMTLAPVRRAVEGAIRRFIAPPEVAEGAKHRFTILAEARSGDSFRNVVVTGADVYGLSAELLAAGALHIAGEGYNATGVLAPTQAVDVTTLQKELIDHGVSVDIFE